MPEASKTVEIVLPPSPDNGEGGSQEIEEVAVGPMFTNDDFQQRVEVIMAAIEDPEKFRRCIAEIHTYLSLFDEGFRQMGQDIANGGGPFAMIKAMFRMGR
jgi:hypothetical protein